LNIEGEVRDAVFDGDGAISSMRDSVVHSSNIATDDKSSHTMGRILILCISTSDAKIFLQNP
jgi:hypothetical protein